MKNLIKKILKEERVHNECGIVYYDYQNDDRYDVHSYANVKDSVLNYTKETMDLFPNKDKVIIPTNQILYSTQNDIDINYIDELSDEVYGEKDIHIYNDNGNLFVMDGHHRICKDRMSGRDSHVYVWDNEDRELIDCIFYGIGDC